MVTGAVVVDATVDVVVVDEVDVEEDGRDVVASVVVGAVLVDADPASVVVGVVEP